MPTETEAPQVADQVLTLELANLHDTDDGHTGQEFNSALIEILEAIRRRGPNAKNRSGKYKLKVELEIEGTWHPNREDTRFVEQGPYLLDVSISKAIPKRKSKTHQIGINRRNQPTFNPGDPENIAQKTLNFGNGR